MPPIGDWTPTHEFEDGPGNTASGEEVMENLRSLGTFLLNQMEGAQGMPLILKSDATDPQPITGSFEAMEDISGDDVELGGLTAGVIYVVKAVVVVSRIQGSGVFEYRVRHGNDTVGESAYPEAGEDNGSGGGVGNIVSTPVDALWRTENTVGWFESDGSTTVSLEVKASGGGDDLELHRGPHTFLLLYPTE